MEMPAVNVLGGMSADGRYVAFVSSVGNLVPDKTNRRRAPTPVPGPPPACHRCVDTGVLYLAVVTIPLEKKWGR